MIFCGRALESWLQGRVGELHRRCSPFQPGILGHRALHSRAIESWGFATSAGIESSSSTLHCLRCLHWLHIRLCSQTAMSPPAPQDSLYLLLSRSCWHTVCFSPRAMWQLQRALPRPSSSLRRLPKAFGRLPAQPSRAHRRHAQVVLRGGLPTQSPCPEPHSLSVQPPQQRFHPLTPAL